MEPGVKLADLARTLAEHGQMLPLGTPWTAHATIGGTIASGIDAPERQLYGTPRDYLLGAEFVTGDGVLAKSGGRVVKNVTGYDMHKLLIGSLGTLGIVTKLNFKTFPLPQNVRGFVAGFTTLEGALEMRHRIARSPLSPITLTSSDPAPQNFSAIRIFWARSIGPLPLACAGSDRVLARYESDLRQIAEQCGASSTEIANEGLAKAWAHIREFIPDGAGPLSRHHNSENRRAAVEARRVLGRDACRRAPESNSPRVCDSWRWGRIRGGAFGGSDR